MFEHLAKWRAIVVSGPQRSGTTIAARMIAADTGHRYIDEAEFGVHILAIWLRVVQDSRGVVVQCPGMSHRLCDIGTLDDVLVLWMLRPTSDILTSQRRIGWQDRQERRHYMRLTPLASEPDSAISDVKLDYWRSTQRARVAHWLELEYESLKEHPLWVPKEQRRRFTAKQWRVDDE